MTNNLIIVYLMITGNRLVGIEMVDYSFVWRIICIDSSAPRPYGHPSERKWCIDMIEQVEHDRC